MTHTQDTEHAQHSPSARHLALVLGGGAAAGQAWEIGIIAGLAEAGLDLTEAPDLVIGTSAGATTAAQIRSGKPPAELLAAVLTPPKRPTQPARPTQPESADPGRQQPPSLPMTEVFDRMRSIGAAATSAEDLQRAMGAFGLESDAVLEPGAAQRRAIVAARLPGPDWPDRPMIIVALDARTGELAAFDRDSGAGLVDAVAASTALPGLLPTVAINGGRYIDGGIRSVDNADLAVGYAHVLVLSPLGGRAKTPPPGQFEGLRRFPETDLDRQVEVLRGQGSRVEVIIPDAASEEAMGANMMDLATRAPTARAGLAQGRREAARAMFG